MELTKPGWGIFLPPLAQPQQLPPSSTPQPFQLEKLTISPARPYLSTEQDKALAMSPQLSRLTELKVAMATAPSIDALFCSDDGVVRNLTSLDLDRVYFEPVQIICKSPHLTNLATLSIRMSVSEEHRHEAFDCLVQSPYLISSNLKHLALRDFGDITWDSFHRLITTLENSKVQLKSLDLTGTTFPFGVLFGSPAFSQLNTLRSSSTYVTKSLTATNQNPDVNHALCATTLQTYAQSPIISNLTHFRLPLFLVDRIYRLGEEGGRFYKWTTNLIESILTSPLMSNNLIELEINICSPFVPFITDQLLETLLTTRVIPGDESSPLKFGKVQKLNLGWSSIGARGVELIVQNLKELTHLNLWGNRNINDAAITALIGDERVDLQFPYPSLPNLIELDLHRCSITDNGWMELSKSQLLRQLKKFGYSDDQITEPGLNLINKSRKDPV